MLISSDIHLLLHVVLDFRCILLTPLKFSQLLVFPGIVDHHGFSLSLRFILLGPSGLVVILDLLVLEVISLLFFLESCLFHLSLELPLLSKFGANITLFFLSSKQLSTSMVSDFLIEIKVKY